MAKKKKESKVDEAMLDRTRLTLERLLGKRRTRKMTNEQAAQDLYYEAMETGDLDLIEDALDLDPENVDCLLVLLDGVDSDDPEGLTVARQIVEIAKKKLGKKTFEEDKGHFWGLLETRPYMRARSVLALRLMAMGRWDEAIKEHEGMLELCPNDNLGIRYPLLALYLQESRLKDAAKLLETYKEERPYSSQMLWGYVLERFLADDLTGAAASLKPARKLNGFFEAYLKGHRKLPKESPGYYSPGSREEAQIGTAIFKPAWDAHPEAIEWLLKMGEKR